MNKRKSIELIQEITSEMALAQDLDRSLFARLSALFGELEKEFSSWDSSFRAAVRQCRSILSGIAAGKSDNVDTDIGLLSRTLTRLYRSARLEAAPRPHDDRACSPPSHGVFATPGGIDADKFLSNIAELKAVLADIEECLVEEVVVDFLERERGNSPEAILCGKFHSIRMEADRLGLLDLEHVCLAVEDFLAKSTAGADRADKLLPVKDWIAGALDSYAASRLPDPPGLQIVTRLKIPERAAPEGRHHLGSGLLETSAQGDEAANNANSSKGRSKV